MVCVDLDFNSVCNYVTSQTEELKGTKPSMSDSSQDEGHCLSVQEYLLMSAISEEGLLALHLVD